MIPHAIHAIVIQALMLYEIGTDKSGLPRFLG